MLVVAGLSYGCSKAVVLVTKRNLMGHSVDKNGMSCDPEQTKSIVEFAPLKDKSHVHMFLGSANWVRRYLAPTLPVSRC